MSCCSALSLKLHLALFWSYLTEQISLHLHLCHHHHLARSLSTAPQCRSLISLSLEHLSSFGFYQLSPHNPAVSPPVSLSQQLISHPLPPSVRPSLLLCQSTLTWVQVDKRKTINQRHTSNDFGSLSSIISISMTEASFVCMDPSVTVTEWLRVDVLRF